MIVDGPNRQTQLWSAEKRGKKHYRRLAIFFGFLLVLAAIDRVREHTREIDVARVGADGVVQAVRIDRESYNEPNELELHAFGAQTAVHLCRADSWSVVNDYTWVARRMIPRLRQQFSKEARGGDGKSGAIDIIESLKRRTDIDTATLAITVNKSEYPWKVDVIGERQIVVGDASAAKKEPFKLHLQLVRRPRTVEFPEGLMIWEARVEGDPLSAPMVPGNDDGGAR